jgi:hypothetical protein
MYFLFGVEMSPNKNSFLQKISGFQVSDEKRLKFIFGTDGVTDPIAVSRLDQ